MYTLTYSQITEEFHISRVVATLGLSLFVIGLGVGPMVCCSVKDRSKLKSLTSMQGLGSSLRGKSWCSLWAFG